MVWKRIDPVRARKFLHGGNVEHSCSETGDAPSVIVRYAANPHSISCRFGYRRLKSQPPLNMFDVFPLNYRLRDSDSDSVCSSITADSDSLGFSSDDDDEYIGGVHVGFQPPVSMMTGQTIRKSRAVRTKSCANEC
jgi:hypothetical protein